ncbi:ethylbenzene dehydrogenase-related protein [Geoalkalibacter halelectricus]|uniref:ethylbenzene dehydrogenase-related protein n=1 Tax=Geoalkalibacter halelectricus TaxID=2847045 RepID=UPI003D1B4484
MTRWIWILAAALLTAAGLGGCREIPADRLYALKLAHPPTEGDWERALPRQVRVRGGRLHELRGQADLNEDMVHAATPACHHGALPPAPISVDLRAFYTDTDLYLRLSWPDATRDDRLKQWRWDGEAWHNEGGLEDGLGILWAERRDFPRFTCAQACHIADFAVSGANFHGRSRMRLQQEGPWLDLWRWRADLSARHGFADDLWLDAAGMHPDVPGELLRANSRAALDPDTNLVPFEEGDAPLRDAEGRAATGFHAPGSTAPGYLVERPRGGRADVRAWSRYESGRWTVILRRALDTGDARDVVFRPGDLQGTAFGLAIMDHTPVDHYASTLEEILVLLPGE